MMQRDSKGVSKWLKVHEVGVWIVMDSLDRMINYKSTIIDVLHVKVLHQG